MKKYWVIFMGLMAFVSNASADGGSKFSIVGGIDYNLYSSSSSLSVNGVAASGTTKGGLGFGGGLLAEINSVELGALYVSKKYNTDASAGGITASTSSSTSVIHIPVLYRFGGGDIKFGLGSFLELGMSGGGSDYGLAAGPRIGGSNGGLFLDLRFNYGLKSPASKNIFALVGYAFGK